MPVPYQKHGRRHAATGEDPIGLVATDITVIAAYVALDQSTPQSVASSSSYDTTISFDTEIFDSHGMWDAGAPTRLTIQQAGIYLFSGTAGFVGNATGDRAASLYRDGSEQLISVQGRAPASFFWGGSCAVATQFEVGEYVELRVAQSSGGSLNTGDCWLSCYAVGASIS